MAALAAVSASDAVTTISRAFAERFAEYFALQLRDPPIPNMMMTTTLVTSSIRARDPLLLWMVERVRDVADDVMKKPSLQGGLKNRCGNPDSF
jgi:hypothetical protein